MNPVSSAHGNIAILSAPPSAFALKGLLLGLTLMLFTAPALRAEFLQPVAVTVNNGEEIQDALINGSGFEDPGVGTPDSVHLGVAGEMWTAIGSIRAEAIFDLGKTVGLTKVYIWNYNAGADTDRGMKEVQVLVSPDTNPLTAKFTGIGTATLAEGGDKAQVIAVAGTNVRLVKIRNESNWGHGYAIGLAEVRFESGEITGNVPTVAISGLNNGDVVPFGSDISLSATVADRDNDLAKVEFFDGATKLDEKTVAPFSTSLKSLAKGEHTLRVVATDKTGKSGWNMVTVAVREVVPGKVIKIDDNLNIGTNVNQIRYSGAWTLAQGNANDPRYLNNDHYADASGSYFEIKFFGVKIDVFATVASHHGTANATIDGGTRYTLNYKAAQRGEQAFIWSSPLLPNREHVLRIAVAGTGVVTADRFDVTQSDTPSADRATVKKWDTTLTGITFELEDLGGSKVDTNTVTLKVDGSAVPVKVGKAGAVTTVTYTPASSFQPGSQHPFKLEAKDTLGNTLGTEATFTVPSPPFPLAGLGEPAGAAGHWSVRQVWNAGRADAVVTAVGIANAATTNGFTGKVFDDKAPAINFVFTPSPGNAGLMPDDQPFPAEAQGLVATDWVTIARGKVRIPRAGDWTIGVHTDDGFSLRFAGHPFASVSGNGAIDEDFPEYVSFAVGTGDSNTRAVLKNLPAGDYVVEFIHFQRVGGAAAEIYAAEGEFVEDGDTAWALIGAPDGLQLVADEVAAQPPLLTRIQNQSGNVTIDFTSSKPAAQHELQESTDLKTWRVVGNATLTATGGNNARAGVSNVTGAIHFYRMMVKP